MVQKDSMENVAGRVGNRTEPIIYCPYTDTRINNAGGNTYTVCVLFLCLSVECASVKTSVFRKDYHGVQYNYTFCCRIFANLHLLTGVLKLVLYKVTLYKNCWEAFNNLTFCTYVCVSVPISELATKHPFPQFH